MGAARIHDERNPRDSESDSDSDNDDEDHDYKTCEWAFKAEAGMIAELNAMREPDGRRGQPFALAFSGGGIRAAAFQAGVLWRLAAADRLKDVEYFAAVSGGGYITTAFASHCVEAGPPEPGQVRDWYLRVVARTLCRMQDNAGNFVRDSVKDPCGPADGSGLLPRVFDAPVLLFMLLVTLMVSPLMLFFLAVVTAFNIDMMYGTFMRIAFCATDSSVWRDAFLYDAFYKGVLLSVAVLLGVQFVFYVVTSVVPGFKTLPPFKPGPGERRPPASRLYLFGHATSAMLARMAITLALFALIPAAVFVMQQVEYGLFEGSPAQSSRCTEYWAHSYRTNSSDYTYLKRLLEAHACSEPSEDKHWMCSLPVPDGSDAGQAHPEPPEEGRPRTVLAEFGLVILGGVVAMLVFLPLIGAGFFFRILAILGPFAIGFFIVQLSQIAVFARVTGNSRGILSLQHEDWLVVEACAIGFFLLVLPFYERIRASFHFYYMRTLQTNFFAGGRDLPIAELLDNPYIPFILLTGTSTDYQPPGDVDTISELSFSPMHCGSEETGYVEMPQEITLAKTAALSGAGCLDAITLAMNSDNIIMRVYLEILNLSWGDYIMFDPHTGGTAWERRRRRACREFIGACAWIVIFALQLVAWRLRDDASATGSSFCLASLLLVKVILALSFYNFVPVLNTITLSSLVRLFHQITSYFYVGQDPPPMLYVTDGGVRDCTTVCQLLHRRCERILLVLANADPEDELKVLQTAIGEALELKLAHFYDADDWTRSLSLTFEEYKRDKSKPFLRLGVSYCFDEEPKQGHLIVVKNRLPASQGEQPVKPLLTEEIITGEEPDETNSDLEEAFHGMSSSHLGSLGCCDCCHTHGLNCGAPFPHGTGANYLYLSPQFCNSLMRLGHGISGEAVDAVTSLPLPTRAPGVRGP